MTKYLLPFVLSSGVRLLQFFNFASYNLSGVEDKEHGNLHAYKQRILFFFFFRVITNKSKIIIIKYISQESLCVI